ncbi:MAG TPA: sialidase family protein [Blastocatellia bacterium]|nr:sialidase family protein [Blastocatellia bacterium]
MFTNHELTASTTQAEAQLSAPVRISNYTGEDEDPSVLLARDGRFYVTWSSKRRSGANIYIKSSEDGRTWSSEERVTSGPGEDYYSSLTQTRDGAFHIAWFRLDRKQKDMNIWYSRSQDARTWTSPAQIANSPKPDWAPNFHADSRGILRIVWSSSQTGNRELFVSQSDDGGRRWSPERQITQSDEEDDFPHMIETSEGELIMAWTRYRKGSPLLSYVKDASAEIVIARSRDGLNWSVPEVVSPPDEKRRHMDLLPFIFADAADKQLYLSWTSSRSDRRGDILLRGLGAEASAYRLLTNEQKSDYDAKIAPTKTPGQYLMVWVSNREGKTDIYSRTFKL